MQFVLPLHNLLRWGVLIFGLWTVINGLTGIFASRRYRRADNASNLLFMIFCDLQLLVGLILFFAGTWFGQMKSGMGDVMKNSYTRFFTVEHAGMMLLAWILVHIGRASVKKAPTDKAKHKKMLLFFGLALLIILISIPWPFREAVARPLYRAF